MIETYRFADFAIRSPIVLPGLSPWPDERPVSEPVGIGFGPAEPDPVDLPPGQVWTKGNGSDRILITFGQIATFLIEGGRRIVVHAADGVDPVLLQMVLASTPLAILCYQRGLLPFHAVALDVDGVGVAIAGRPGTGKSTLAAALVERGACLIADDLLPLHVGADETLMLPGVSRLDLWPHSLKHLYGNAAMGERVRPHLEKRGLSPERTSLDPSPLRLLIILANRAEREDPVELQGAMLAATLIENTYRKSFMSRLNLTTEKMMRAATVGGQIKAIRLTRDNEIKHLAMMVDFIENQARRFKAAC